MCRLRYRTERRSYQARLMCLSIAIIDGAVRLKIPALELHSRAVPSEEAHHRVSGANTGGRRIIKKNVYKKYKHPLKDSVIFFNLGLPGEVPYISTSRAIYSITNVIVPTKDGRPQETIKFPPLIDFYSSALNSDSVYLRMKCDPAVEIFAYHQEMHTSLELLRDRNILNFLIQNIEYYVTNLNGYFAATLQDDKIVKGFWVRP